MIFDNGIVLWNESKKGSQKRDTNNKDFIQRETQITNKNKGRLGK